MERFCCFHDHFSFKLFPKYAFVRDISPTQSDSDLLSWCCLLCGCAANEKLHAACLALYTIARSASLVSYSKLSWMHNMEAHSVIFRFQEFTLPNSLKYSTCRVADWLTIDAIRLVDPALCEYSTCRVCIIIIIILSFDIAPLPYKHAQRRITFIVRG